MYGLINSSLQGMIRDKFGDDQWDKVLAASGVPHDAFLSMRSYDDALTYQLVGAASDILGEPAATCLEMFGEYWVTEVANKSYGPLMDASGDTLVEFLGNLNTLHDRITSTFLSYVPPEFRVESEDDNCFRIHYVSKRKGLVPFVNGLLKGLALRFGNKIEIFDLQAEESREGTHAVYQVVIT